MQVAIDQFRINIDRVRSLCAIYKVLKAKTTEALDLTDILRAAIVTAVSALDHYIHEITRLGMLEVYQGRRAATAHFQRFQVSLEGVRQGIHTPTSDSWLENEIRVRHSWQSFQHSEKIADAIRLVSNVRLWEEVANRLGSTSDDVKRQLNLIIERRQKIAHEADVDPSFPGRRWPIDEVLVDNAIAFIERVAEVIYEICR